MTLDKWQTREVAQHAKDNDVPEDQAREELFPAEAPARRPLSTERTDGDDVPEDPKAPKDEDPKVTTPASGSRARSTK